MRTECQIILFHFLLLISHWSLEIASLKASLYHIRSPILDPFICSLITPWLPPGQIMLHFTLCFCLPSNFGCYWLYGYEDYYSCLWTAEVIYNFFLASEATNLNTTSKIAFTDPFTSSVHEYWKIFLTEDPSYWPCIPNQPNVLPPLLSPGRHHCPHNTSQRKNIPNQQFHLGLLSTYNPPDPHYENPLSVSIK